MVLLMNVKPYFTTYLYSILAVILTMNFLKQKYIDHARLRKSYFTQSEFQ
jgi:hypothetical protein